MNSTTIASADFDAILVSELEALRRGEKRLTRLYAQLQKKPHLRDRFLDKLSELRQRTERLHAVLNPCEVFQLPVVKSAAPEMRPAA